MEFPDRFGPLIKQLEDGRPLTSEDVQRTASLQELDQLKLSEDFVRESVVRNRRRTQEMRERHDRHVAEIGGAK